MDYLYYPETSYSAKKEELASSVDPTAVVLDFKGLSQRRCDGSSGQDGFGPRTSHYNDEDACDAKKQTTKQRDEIVADQQFYAVLAVSIVCLMVIILLVIGLMMTVSHST